MKWLLISGLCLSLHGSRDFSVAIHSVLTLLVKDRSSLLFQASPVVAPGRSGQCQEPCEAMLEGRGWVRSREGGKQAEKIGFSSCGRAQFVFPPSSLPTDSLLHLTHVLTLSLTHTHTHTHSLHYHSSSPRLQLRECLFGSPVEQTKRCE